MRDSEFQPAERGDLAVVQRPGMEVWTFGEVEEVERDRVRLITTSDNRRVHVHPGDRVRVLPMRRLDKTRALEAWLKGPLTFKTLEEAREHLRPCLEEEVDG